MIKSLGIETSCDETAVAIVTDQKQILSNIISSQIKIHEQYGGVVPEVAARAHAEILDKLILKSLEEAKLKFEDLDLVSVTAGPGLIGGVIVGLMAAKTISSVYKKPFIAVNHLEAHALTARLTNDVQFPYLLLLISGGHCQILLARAVNNYEKIGGTIDDALGEAFDKVAQMLGLPYPGGVAIEQKASAGNENRFKFPKPLIDNDFKKEHLFSFSFSGLKTAVKREIEKLTGADFSHQNSYQKLSLQDINDICASFQKIAAEILVDRIKNSLNYLQQKNIAVSTLVLAGGVAANRYIFGKISDFCVMQKNQIIVVAPPIKLCTDNAAMIAWNGIEKFKLGLVDDLGFKPRAKWELSYY